MLLTFMVILLRIIMLLYEQVVFLEEDEDALLATRTPILFE